MRFVNRVAVVTGASSGIGWCLAKRLAAARAKVGLIARRRDQLEKLADEIKNAGGVAVVATADVGDREQNHRAIHEVVDAFGPVDLLVANAGVGMPTLLDPVNIIDVEQMFRVNVFGMIYAVEAVLPDMLKRGGQIAAVSSLAAYKGLPGESAYCASKAAVSAYMDGLRIHLRDKGIPVTTICPGFVKTPMTDVNEFKMPWVMEADEAARRIMGALDRRTKVFNFPWQTTLLMKLTRWLPDRMLARTMGPYNEKPPFQKPPS